MAHTYLSWDKKIITDFASENINSLYNQGYVFTRAGWGRMDQTRSLRIDLTKFKLTSENKRVLKKAEAMELKTSSIPYSDYHWSIGKLATDFYTKKFGAGTFSANKAKELMTNKDKSNFNVLLQFVLPSEASRTQPDDPSPAAVGYCVARETDEILHYCYPFYNTESAIPNLGMGMMLRAILYASEAGKKFIYLGSFQRPGDSYKLQFEGLEWWDGLRWTDDIEKLKIILN